MAYGWLGGNFFLVRISHCGKVTLAESGCLGLLEHRLAIGFIKSPGLMNIFEICLVFHQVFGKCSELKRTTLFHGS